MPALPVLSGKKLIAILAKNDYCTVRRKGSHVFVENADGSRGTSVPIHGNEDLGKGILKKVLNDLELTADDLLRMLRE